MKGSQVDLENRFLELMKGPFFVVILFKIDSYQTFKQKHDEKTSSLTQFSICYIAEELSGMEAVVIDKDEIGLLCQLEKKVYPVDLYNVITEIQKSIVKLYDFTLSVGIGPIVDSKGEIRNSYRYAKENITSRFF